MEEKQHFLVKLKEVDNIKLLSHSVLSSRIQSFNVLFSLRMFQIYNEQSGVPITFPSNYDSYNAYIMVFHFNQENFIPNYYTIPL